MPIGASLSASTFVGVTAPGVMGAPSVFTAGPTSLNVDITPPNDTGGAPLVRFDLRWSLDGSNWTDVIGVDDPAPIGPFDVVTTVYVQSRSVNAAGKVSGWSASGIGATSADVPGRPTAPSVAATGSTTATVTLSTDPDGNGSDIESRDLRYSVNGGSAWTEVEDVLSPVQLSGLPVNTEVLAQWRAVNGEGPGEWSPSGSATTSSAVAQAVIDATPDGTYTDGAGVDWSYVTLTSGASVSATTAGVADVLLVAGGGAGGARGGAGGGHGEVVERRWKNSTAITLSLGSHSYTHGAGGARTSYNGTTSRPGGDASFAGLTAKGGGTGATIYRDAGAGVNGAGQNGGGGGGGANNGQGASIASDGIGFAGGEGYSTTAAGGGGGGGGVGSDAGSSGGGTGGDGGDGYVSDITGSNAYYAAGGGGAGNAFGSGGQGGGGDATLNGGVASDATGYGSGGGGAKNDSAGGGAGSDGVLIVAWPTTPFEEAVPADAPEASGTIPTQSVQWGASVEINGADYFTGYVESYSLSGSNYLTVDSSTGAISGTMPSADVAETVTLTATNATGSATQSFDLFAAETVGVPVSTNQRLTAFIPDAYVGEPLALDFTGCWGNATNYSYDGPEPHSWSGAVLTITPSASYSGTETRTVTPSNASGSGSSKTFSLRVSAAPATLAAGTPTDDLILEVGLGMGAISLRRNGRFTGGLPFPNDSKTTKFKYSKVSGPSWVVVEPNGIVRGIPDAAHQATTLTVRCEDARGDTADLDLLDITVLTSYDRTTNKIVANPANDLFLTCRNNAQAGRYIELTPGETYTWGDWSSPDSSPVPSGGLPCVIGCPDGTAIVDGIKVNAFKNLVFENFKIRCGGGTMADSLNEPYRIYFKDINGQGTTQAVDPDDPEGGWKTDDEWRYIGQSFRGGWEQSVWQNLDLSSVAWGCKPGGYELAIYGLESYHVRIDAFQTNNLSDSYIADVHCHHFGGNFTYLPGNEEHRDLFQFERAGNLPDRAEANVMDRVRLYAGGVDDPSSIQAFFKDLDGVSTSERYFPIENAYRDYIFRDCVVTTRNSQHALALCSYANTLVERCVILGHVDGGDVGTYFSVGEPSTATIKDTIYYSVRYRTGTGSDKCSRFIDLSDNNVQANSLSAVLDAFPAWATAGAADDEDAMIVLSATWAAANPGVGPNWLTTA